ncbi:uncharacterized protein LOC120632890 [Pararge aegeria]|uniref:uncharacterized protein LOC120632890 n=1 Tax=Pararge aegeria TaxID=116150 RepID=UPI0019D0EA3E|nr:uncharacterized protein LOC120632890 [Pararge aegeria]
MDEQGVYCQAFADDVVLVFSGHNTQDIEIKANTALEQINQWGSLNKLKFAAQKTHAMLITRKFKYDTPHLNMGGKDITLVKEIKILGITIDSKLTYKKHISNISKKALNIYKQLSRAAKVSWGLNPEVIRTIYAAAVEPIVLYAASVWAKSLEQKGIQKQLNTIQREFAQKICKAYKTVSLHSALLLAGLVPLDLRVQEQAKLYEAKRGRPLEYLPDDREIEQRISFMDAEHPAFNKSIDYSCIDSLNLETIQKHRIEGAFIFTDGSKIKGKVGVAISVWERGVETKAMKLKLEPFCTVFQAEMYALDRAVRHIKDKNIQKSNLFSDSKSSLDLIKRHTTTHPLACSIRKNLIAIQKQGKALHIFWVKAHVGVEGNERADHLDKEAALYKRTKADYDACPISYIKHSIRSDTLEKWQNRYGKIPQDQLPEQLSYFYQMSNRPTKFSNKPN